MNIRMANIVGTRSMAILGCVGLGIALGSIEFLLREITLQSLLRIPSPENLPDGAAKGFVAFRAELAYRIAGDKILMPWDVGPKRLSVIRSEKLDRSFPNYLFLKTDWTGRLWAVPRESGPIWYLDDWAIIGDFLAFSRQRIRSKEDAAYLNGLCMELMPDWGAWSDANEPDNMRRWRIGIWRSQEKMDVSGPRFVELNLDASGFVECAFRVAQDPQP